MMLFTLFAVIEKTQLTKRLLNQLELALAVELEKHDACLAIDSTGTLRRFSASNISLDSSRELHGFVHGWLAAKAQTKGHAIERDADDMTVLRKENAELAKALRACVNAINYQHEPNRALLMAKKIARAAISKHKG